LPDAVCARLTSASIEQLETWMLNVLDADRNRSMNEALTAYHPIRKAMEMRPPFDEWC